MSEMSREARRQNRAKAHRLATQTPGKVDASDYGPEENLEADVKTGMRPVSRRAYKAGGKVEGEKPAQNAGKMQRTGKADGGSAERSRGEQMHENARAKALSSNSGIAGVQDLGRTLYQRKGNSQNLLTGDRSSGALKTIGKTGKWNVDHKGRATPEWAEASGPPAPRKTRAAGGKADWSDEAKSAAKHMTRDTMGSGVPKEGYSPARGLANKLQKMSSADRAHNPGKGQWEAMMSALPRSGGRQKAHDLYGGRKVTSEREYASGGSVANSIANVDQKAANQERDGVKKVGGLKRGGRAEGGEVPTTRFSINPSGGSRMTQAAGLKAGGRTARSTGGDIALGLASPIGLGIKSLIGGRGDSDKDGKKAGGSVSDGTQQGTRPTGGRIARAAGGKAPEAPHVKRNGYFVPNNSGLAKGRNYNDPGGTAKAEAAERARQPRATGGRTGKTNINIIIGRPSPSGQPDPSGLPPSPGGPGAMPMPVPVGPPGLGAMGAAIPGGPPPGAAPAGAPPPMPMPMGRKSGGRTVMTAGSESGVGRLEKTAIAKKDRLR